MNVLIESYLRVFAEQNRKKRTKQSERNVWRRFFNGKKKSGEFGGGRECTFQLFSFPDALIHACKSTQDLLCDPPAGASILYFVVQETMRTGRGAVDFTAR